MLTEDCYQYDQLSVDFKDFFQRLSRIVINITNYQGISKIIIKEYQGLLSISPILRVFQKLLSRIIIAMTNSQGASKIVINITNYLGISKIIIKDCYHQFSGGFKDGERVDLPDQEPQASHSL